MTTAEGLSPAAGAIAEALQQRLATKAFVRPSGLAQRLAVEVNLSLLETHQALRELVQHGWVRGVSSTGIPVHVVTWTGPERTPWGGEARWLAAIEAVGPSLGAQERAWLAREAALLPDLELEDAIALLQGVFALRGDTRSQDPWVRSARHLLGSSKAARNLKGLLRRLGVDDAPDTSELYVVTAGPDVPTAIVLLENPRVFTAFRRSKHITSALGVVTHGYGLTWENLGERLRAGRVVCCPAEGPRVDLAQLLTQLPAVFWGDLDLEGLRIFESLRTHLPELALSQAYRWLDARVADRCSSHPYHALFEKVGQRAPQGMTAEVRYLAARCTQRAVDHEISPEELNTLDLCAPFRIPASD